MASPEPWHHPSGWHADALRATDDWRLVLDADDVREIEGALGALDRRRDRPQGVVEIE